MNKRRHILQRNFNDRRNGYYGYGDGDYYTRVNWEHIGLLNWGKLRYYIR